MPPLLRLLFICILKVVNLKQETIISFAADDLQVWIKKIWFASIAQMNRELFSLIVESTIQTAMETTVCDTFPTGFGHAAMRKMSILEQK